MRMCFKGCSSLIYLDIEKWTINDNCNINKIFEGCDNLSLVKCTKKTYKKLLRPLNWTYENGYAVRG